MRKLFIGLLLLVYATSHSQPADTIIGKWMKTPKEDMIIEVYKTATDYEAKISWTKVPDEKKPIGYVLMDKLTYDAKGKSWENGKIHAPGSDKTYSATAELLDNGKLKVLGYMGMKFLGKTKYFRRVK